MQGVPARRTEEPVPASVAVENIARRSTDDHVGAPATGREQSHLVDAVGREPLDAIRATSTDHPYVEVGESRRNRQPDRVAAAASVDLDPRRTRTRRDRQ